MQRKEANMNTQNESQGQEEFRKDRPSPEMTAELLAKAKKVTAWLSALKQRSRLRPFVGTSTDGKFCVVLRNHHIESLNADETLADASVQEIVSRLCEAHNDALDKMEAWSASQCEALAKAAGIQGDFELPF